MERENRSQRLVRFALIRCGGACGSEMIDGMKRFSRPCRGGRVEDGGEPVVPLVPRFTTGYHLGSLPGRQGNRAEKHPRPWCESEMMVARSIPQIAGSRLVHGFSPNPSIPVFPGVRGAECAPDGRTAIACRSDFFSFRLQPGDRNVSLRHVRLRIFVSPADPCGDLCRFHRIGNVRPRGNVDR